MFWDQWDFELEVTGISSGLLEVAVSTSHVGCLHDEPHQKCELAALSGRQENREDGRCDKN